MSEPPRLLAVLNGAAGSAAGPGGRDALAVLDDGGDLEVVRTRSRADLRDALERLDGRRLVVMGGDGSINAVLSALHAAGGPERLRAVGPLGVVPLGTGNDLARSLGLPVGAPAAAARAALHGAPRDVELVVADDGTVVVNAVHAGIGASAARRAERVKPVLGRVAYPVGAVAAGVAGRPWHLRVVVDDRVVHDGSSGVLMVALNLGATVGGGAPVSPAATPHDGLVDVVVSTATGPVARAGFATSMLRGHHVHRHDTATTRGARVVVEAVDGRPFVVNTDGDLSDERTRFAWTAVGDAWSVLVPQPRHTPPRGPGSA